MLSMKNLMLLVVVAAFFLGGGNKVFAQNYATAPVGVFKSAGIVDINRGSVVCRLRFVKNAADRTQHVIFHTSDSRIVLSVSDYWSEKAQRKVLKISARAGGNRKVNDLYPEASVRIDNDASLKEYGWATAPFPEGEWHFVAMTWEGYGQGVVRIYLDSRLVSQKEYDPKYDDGRPLFSSFSVGFRSRNFGGSVTRTSSGVVEEKPSSDLSLASGGIEMKDLRVYGRVLQESDLKRIMAK